jgi:hypothetical protein
MLLLLCGWMMTGCALEQDKTSAALHEPDSYEKLTYRTAEVSTGTLYPEFTLTLNAEGRETKYYGSTADDLEVERVYVSVGDKVKKGDQLVSFRSDAIEESIENYQEQIQQNRLLIEHYTKLMKIDDSADYEADIASLEEDNEVTELYLEEAKEKLKRYQLVAEASGTITAIDEYLQNGMYRSGNKLITEVCGTGNYTTRNTENYAFVEGDVYTAKSGVVSYDLKLTKVEGDLLTFAPVSDMSAVSDEDTLLMTMEKPKLRDVVYVESAAVYTVEDRNFVYVLDEDGFRDVVWVTVGDTVDGYDVITEGLSGGEKVTLQ